MSEKGVVVPPACETSAHDDTRCRPWDSGGVKTWDETATRQTYGLVADAYADFFRSTEGEQPIDLAMIGHFSAGLGADPLVVDAGCGAGRMMPVLASLGCRVEGIDLTPDLIRRARADHGEFVTTVGSLTALPFADGRFDGLFMWYSTIHADDDGVALMLAQAHRVLADDGSLLVAFQTGDSVREVGQGFRDRGFDVTLMRFHRRAARMATLLESAGFRVTTALDRAPVGGEVDGQAVLVARRIATMP